MKMWNTGAITDMKRLLIPIIVLLLFLSSCGTQHADFAPGNTGSTVTSPIMPSGSGYYYSDRTDHKMSLKYYDTATGKSIYLCSRPECLHDGSPFCSATSDKYSLLGMSLYEDVLYLEVLEWDYEKTERYFRLLRASKDGTELSEVCTFRKYTAETNSGGAIYGIANPVIHRGKAYLPYCINSGENNICGIAQADIFTGASKIIFEREQSATLPVLMAYENTVCFPVYNEYGSYSLFEYEISADSLTERAAAVYPQSVAAAENGWIYIDTTDLYFLDSSTNESTMPENEMSEFVRAGTGSEIKFDGSYYYIFRNDPFDSVFDDVKTFTCAVFSKNMQKLAEFQFEAGTDWRLWSAISLDILDGVVYIQRYGDVICCPLSDILAGNIHWETAYEFDRKYKLLTSEEQGE